MQETLKIYEYKVKEAKTSQDLYLILEKIMEDTLAIGKPTMQIRYLKLMKKATMKSIDLNNSKPSEQVKMEGYLNVIHGLKSDLQWAVNFEQLNYILAVCMNTIPLKEEKCVQNMYLEIIENTLSKYIKMRTCLK